MLFIILFCFLLKTRARSWLMQRCLHACTCPRRLPVNRQHVWFPPVKDLTRGWNCFHVGVSHHHCYIMKPQGWVSPTGRKTTSIPTVGTFVYSAGRECALFFCCYIYGLSIILRNTVPVIALFSSTKLLIVNFFKALNISRSSLD